MSVLLVLVVKVVADSIASRSPANSADCGSCSWVLSDTTYQGASARSGCTTKQRSFLASRQRLSVAANSSECYRQKEHQCNQLLWCHIVSLILSSFHLKHRKRELL